MAAASLGELRVGLHGADIKVAAVSHCQHASSFAARRELRLVLPSILAPLDLITGSHGTTAGRSQYIAR
jgi:hypothetical protein